MRKESKGMNILRHHKPFKQTKKKKKELLTVVPFKTVKASSWRHIL
jgi:hypothetical protein